KTGRSAGHHRDHFRDESVAWIRLRISAEQRLGHTKLFDVANAPNPTKVPPFQRNQFGGAVGGPSRHDKMFFFGNYEGFRERLAVSRFGYVPSREVRQGLWPNAAGQYVQAPNLEPRILPFFRYWPEPNGPEQLLNGLPTGTARYSANPKRSVLED